MISFPSYTEIFVCHTPVSFGCGIDGMVRYCRIILKKDPLDKAYFMFINKSSKQVRVLWYDGQGFTLCTKRSSQGIFLHWPKNKEELNSILTFSEADVLFSGGDHTKVNLKKLWKKAF